LVSGLSQEMTSGFSVYGKSHNVIMSLSESATTELQDILRQDIGDAVDELTQEELQRFGDFVLTVMATSLKIRARLQ
jgi:hypothetical protein